jgi:hypothetical protein
MVVVKEEHPVADILLVHGELLQKAFEHVTINVRII